MDTITKIVTLNKVASFTVIWKVKSTFLKSPPQAPLGSGFCTDPPPLKMSKIFGRGGICKEFP